MEGQELVEEGVEVVEAQVHLLMDDSRFLASKILVHLLTRYMS